MWLFMEAWNWYLVTSLIAVLFINWHMFLFSFSYFSLNPNLTSQFGLGSLSLPSKCKDYRQLSGFYIGSRHPNPVFHPWAASTLSTESPPQLCCLQKHLVCCLRQEAKHEDFIPCRWINGKEAVCSSMWSVFFSSKEPAFDMQCGGAFFTDGLVDLSQLTF